MTTTTVSPFVIGSIEEVELADTSGNKKKYWKKEILPSGTRKYKGQTLDFAKINPACVTAFNEKAFDQVPFVLALADNSHPNTGQEIETLEGDLAKLELSKEGSLFGYFDLSNSAVALEKIKKSNGKLGVSGRIEVDYVAGDTGKTFPYALKHVCATTAPHIKGLKPWESVDLTEEEKSQETVDFSTEVIDESTKTKETGDDLVAVEIPKDKLDKLLGLLADVEDAEKKAASLNQPSEPAQLSEEATKRIELAETAARTAYAIAERSQIDAAKTSWAARERDYALAGVPPALLTEAGKVLSLHKRPSIELTDSDGNKTTIDATEVIENILEAAKGTVKLSQEDGHGFTDSKASANDKEYADFEAQFFADFGK